MVTSSVFCRWSVALIAGALLPIPASAQHTPGISATAIVITGFATNEPGFGGAVRGELPVFRLTQQISLVLGAGGWLARTPTGAADGPSGYTEYGAGPYAGLALAAIRPGGAIATVTAGIEWLHDQDGGCGGLVPPGGCGPPPPPVETMAVTLGFRIHGRISPRTSLEGGLVLSRHELRAERRTGKRLELGLRFGVGR